MRRRTTAIALTSAVLAVLLAGCASAEPAPPPTTTPPDAGASLAAVTSVGVLGDSVSVGVNACDEPGWCASASWATGDDPAVESVAYRLAALIGDEPSATNAAIDGGTVADALDAAGEVLAADPGLVLLLLGGNDVCKRELDDMTDAASFRTSYTALLERINTAAPEATILALSIPDLHRLWEIGHDNPDAVAVWDSSPSCRNLLGDAQATDAAAEDRRAAVAARNSELNAVIAEVCTADTRCLTDGGAVFDYAFAPDEISSIDFFHPSVAGERVIADIAWRALEEGMS